MKSLPTPFRCGRAGRVACPVAQDIRQDRCQEFDTGVLESAFESERLMVKSMSTYTTNRLAGMSLLERDVLRERPCLETALTVEGLRGV